MVFVTRVKDVFQITGRGVIIVLDRDTWAPDVKIRKNDDIQLRTPDGKTIDTRITDISLLRPVQGWRRRDTGILLPPNIGKDEIGVSTEIWLMQRDKAQPMPKSAR